MAEAHSTWSASGFEQRMLCPGSHVLQMGAPRTSTVYSAEGTAAHQLLTWALQDRKDAAAYIGRVIEADGFTFTVDDDMAAFIQTTLNYVRDVAGANGLVLVDRKVNYSSYLDVPADEAWGTLDVAVLRGDEIIAIDLKYGQGVQVEAGSDVGQVKHPNPQLALYALGVLQEYQEFADFNRARLVISQPRISERPSEYDLSVEQLEAWGRGAARSAVSTCRNAAAMGATTVGAASEEGYLFLRPGDKQCKFCKAKATCPAVRDDVLDTIGINAAGPDEFADTPVPSAAHIAPTDAAWLAAALAKVDLIEGWCEAVRAEAHRRLTAGDRVPGFKLVKGRRGPRTWADAAAVEAYLKGTVRLKDNEMYDFKLVSPTTIEKRLKPWTDADGAERQPLLGPRQWERVQAHITQSDGKPSVAPESDSRPALEVTPVANDFEPVTPDVSEFA